MKRIFQLCLFMIIPCILSAKEYEDSDIFSGLRKGEKVAVLMVHFGTTHGDTRKLTIDAVNALVKQKYPETEVREAYTSRIIIKRLHDKFGISKRTPLEALMQLHLDGFTRILVQPTTLIDGAEMLSLQKDVDKMAEYFTDIRVGNPLLYTPEDYKQVVKILTKDNQPQKAYVLVGHGTSYSNTAQYTMMDYVLKAEGHHNFFVGTIEGYPTFDDMLAQLQASKLKNVVLLPFMFVAGEHANNDIAKEWKEKLEAAGYSVEVLLEGLGQNTDIQNIYLSHLDFIVKHKRLDIMQKKAVYEITGEKME